MKISDIEVNIIKKNIKNAHLYVKPPDGIVEVSCPLNYSDENVRLFVSTKLSWIRRQREKFLNQPRQSRRQYISGETVYLFGKQYFLQVDYNLKSYNIKKDNEKIYFVVREGSSVKQREKIINEWYRELLKTALDSIITKIVDKSGLRCNGYSITNMKSKWGSCNIKTKKLNFNLQLIKAPIPCIEYVVLHELAHTIEMHHNAHFISILDKFMPTWREIKNQLNSQYIDQYV